MANDKEADDDLQPVAWTRLTDATGETANTRVTDPPGEVPVGRLDYGDADQLAEMDGVDDEAADELIELVDTPIQIRQPFTRAEKRRNQRPLPT